MINAKSILWSSLFQFVVSSVCMAQNFQLTFLSPMEIGWGTSESELSYTVADKLNLREPITCNYVGMDNNGNYYVSDCLDQSAIFFDSKDNFLFKLKRTSLGPMMPISGPTFQSDSEAFYLLGVWGFVALSREGKVIYEKETGEDSFANTAMRIRGDQLKILRVKADGFDKNGKRNAFKIDEYDTKTGSFILRNEYRAQFTHAYYRDATSVVLLDTISQEIRDVDLSGNPPHVVRLLSTDVRPEEVTGLLYADDRMYVLSYLRSSTSRLCLPPVHQRSLDSGKVLVFLEPQSVFARNMFTSFGFFDGGIVYVTDTNSFYMQAPEGTFTIWRYKIGVCDK